MAPSHMHATTHVGNGNVVYPRLISRLYLQHCVRHLPCAPACLERERQVGTGIQVPETWLCETPVKREHEGRLHVWRVLLEQSKQTP